MKKSLLGQAPDTASPRELNAGDGYLACGVFGRAASSARAAIQASYSAVPGRGGTPAGKPPIQCGMSASRSPAVWPAQEVRRKPASHSKAH